MAAYDDTGPGGSAPQPRRDAPSPRAAGHLWLVGAVPAGRDGGAGVAGRVACAERLAICLEGGDVSEARARELAEEDAAAQRCGRMCTCRES